MHKLTLLQTLATGRLLACKVMPYFTDLFLSLTPHAVENLGTFGVTDKSVFLFDPALLEKWDMKKIGFVYSHEGFHVYYRSFARGKRLGVSDPELWNLANDAKINHDLQKIWSYCPPDAITPAKLKVDAKKSIEEIYIELLQRKKEGEQFPKVCCGSGAGNPFPNEPKTPDKDKSPVEVESIVRDAAQEIAAQAGKEPGKLPGCLVGEADSILAPPKISWQEKLRRFVREAISYQKGMVDIGWLELSRDQAAIGYGSGKPILPCFVEPIITVEFALDTSASMTPKELGIAMREVQGIISAAGGKLQMFAFDTKIQAKKKITSVAEATKLLKGRGGTKFDPVFAELRSRPKNKLPSIFIVATDGFADEPKPPPKSVQTIWLLTGDAAQKPASWGEVVRVTND